MEIINIIDSTNIPRNGVVSLGTFDGVHRGHIHIINNMNELSKKNYNATKTIITFKNCPKKVLNHNINVELISTIDEKLEIFEKNNIDFVYLIEFTKEFSILSAINFLESYINPFSPKYIVIGRDHFFGNNKEGNSFLLNEMSNKYNYQIVEASSFLYKNKNVSSTDIRNLIKRGDVLNASDLLGYQYSFIGNVVKGYGVGTKLGYPTANLDVEKNKLLPTDGVYSANIVVDNKKYCGMLYIGNRPTFNKFEKTVEVNIFDFNNDIYNKTIKIEPKHYIRSDIKFLNKEELLLQIKKDEIQVKKMLNL